MGYLSRFLWFCAGADEQILSRGGGIMVSDKKKFSAIGASMFFSTVLVLISSYHTFSIVTGSEILSVLLAIVWAMIFFNLVRFFVGGQGAAHVFDTSPLSFAYSVLVGVIFSCLVGMVIAIPLATYLFQADIEIYLANENRSELNLALHQVQHKHAKQLEGLVIKLAAINSQSKNSLGAESIIEENSLTDITCGNLLTSRIFIGNSEKRTALNECEARLDEEIKRLAKNGLNDYSDSIVKANAELSADEVRRKLQHELLLVTKEKISIAREHLAPAGIVRQSEIAFSIAPIFCWLLLALCIFFQLGIMMTSLLATRTPYDYLVEMQNDITLAKKGVMSRFSYVFDRKNRPVPIPAFHGASEVIDEVRMRFKQVNDDLFEARRAFMQGKKSCIERGARHIDLG